jgi:uncharacterized protein (DUF934 family)
MTELANTKLIKNGAVIDDRWQLLREVVAQELPTGAIIVPLGYWLEHREQLLARGDVGVWLAGEEAPASLKDDLDKLPVVAIDFPLFTDGRGFSYGRMLREHFGYKGEVRAVGQFIRDQLYYLSRCGFDAFAIETSDPEQAIASLYDFSDSYSAGIDQPLPWFRRSGV